MSRLAPAPSLPLAVTRTWTQATLKHNRQLYCCRFSADGQFVFAGAQDGTIIRWSLADAASTKADAKTTQTPGVLLKGHATWVSGLLATPDGSRLISSDLHGTLIGWDVVAEKTDAAQPPNRAWTVTDAHPTKPGQPG